MSYREIVLVLSADEAEGIADILSMQWYDPTEWGRMRGEE